MCTDCPRNVPPHSGGCVRTVQGIYSGGCVPTAHGMCHHIPVDLYRLSREAAVSTVNNVKLLNFLIGDFAETNY
jgi:hypothetical protein